MKTMIKEENKKNCEIPEFIPLHNDLMFKHIFGYQKNSKFVIDLLEEFYLVEKGKFRNSKILNSVKLDKESIKDKGFELDILVELPDKRKIIIEMYNNYDINAEIKSLMYLTNKFSTQLSKGEKYKDIDRVIILNFVRGDKVHEKGYIRRYTIINEENVYDKILPDYFKFYIIDIDSGLENNYNISKRFKRWTEFINASNEKDVIKIIRKDEIMEEAYEEMKKFKKNEHWGTGYFHPSRLIESQHASALEEAEEKGKTQGISEGITQGIEKGIEQGENNRSIEIAKNMIEKGYDINSIIEITSLTKEQIEQLKEER